MPAYAGPVSRSERDWCRAGMTNCDTVSFQKEESFPFAKGGKEGFGLWGLHDYGRINHSHFSGGEKWIFNLRLNRNY